MSARIWIFLAGLLGAAAVTLGAYHAHGLQEMLEGKGLDAAEVAKQLHNCDVAVKYQMYHALALLGVGILLSRRGSLLLNVAGVIFLLGVAGFSGGLYFMVFDVAHLHWSVIPAGGALLILGWLLVAITGALVSFAGDENS